MSDLENHPGAGRRPLLQAPAIQALLLFALGLVGANVIDVLWQRAGFSSLSPLQTSLLHGVIAALLARLRRMAVWWWLILLVFPLAALLVARLHLPSWMFLAVFLFMLVLFWSTFRSQVPFYPSGRSAWDAVAGLLPEGRVIRFMDIGSGLGGAVLDLSRRRPESEFIGIEIAPLPWLVSRLRAALAGNRCRFVRGDYLLLDFADYDVVFAYLSPAAMLALWHKARAEMRPGTLLLSYEFHIPGSTPDLVIQPEGEGPVLHGWRM
ncbi:class I SAM-dependent methyltransferase [Herbaspirillum sp. AP02]|uniref:class I SAM-dependent methyltransferase n=1 Tax=unclassified Herbaspirillum TaxID=2624150 RepID=UPI0015DA3D1F|nr:MULTISPECIES: class I SAM-dependent methyltransferase [unclassified Herbaspirillum]MBG7620661.1 class I SAM-dependent methyltransferase [Herbaspirillum sp. AP02]NZD68125.1 class I SAM-dependent methyltransferase [Herbaspirillum sp. AP21]